MAARPVVNNKVAVLAAVLMMTLLVLTGPPPLVNGLTCGQVVGMLSPCIRYAMGRDANTSPACCSGVRNLNAAARSTADRQTTCNCLKQQASGRGGLRPDLVAGIPGKCGVNVPYPLSPNTDCSKVR